MTAETTTLVSGDGQTAKRKMGMALGSHCNDQCHTTTDGEQKVESTTENTDLMTKM